MPFELLPARPILLQPLGAAQRLRCGATAPRPLTAHSRPLSYDDRGGTEVTEVTDITEVTEVTEVK